MNCDCKKDIETRLTERFKTDHPDGTDHGVELTGYGMVITDGSLLLIPCMQYKTSAIFPLKKGGTKCKTSTGSMFFNFCPFCGKSVKESNHAE